MKELSDLTVPELADGIRLRAGRIAAASAELPELAQAFAAGRLSYCQARAITRVATPEDGIDWVGLARSASGAQIEKLARGIRRARAAGAVLDPLTVELRARARQRARERCDDEGNLLLTFVIPVELAAVVKAALQAQRELLDRTRFESDDVSAETPAPVGDTDVSAETRPCVGAADVSAETPAKATDADALVAMAEAALDAEGRRHPGAARRSRARLKVQVDPLSGWARMDDGELLPPHAVASLPSPTRRSRCGGARLRTLGHVDLRRHDQGRKAREATPALRELLEVVDGRRCRFPGCSRDRALDAHHVRYWSHGGGTDFDNLVLLCTRHHTLVHALGFGLRLHPDRRLDVRTANGAAIQHHPGMP
ncbi:MAG TPA: HNH endonuclease signature motif containing protein, partial [Mycobacteriales bacterium]|nr:HNH endonuclease signature motif containing protein [Mycobacteriales bacterium]